MGSTTPLWRGIELAEEIIENLEAGLNSFRQVLSALNEAPKDDAPTRAKADVGR